MNLTTEETEELRQLIESRDLSALRRISVEHVSLGAAVELARYRATANGDSEISGLFDGWAARVPLLSAAFKNWPNCGHDKSRPEAAHARADLPRNRRILCATPPPPARLRSREEPPVVSYRAFLHGRKPRQQ